MFTVNEMPSVGGRLGESAAYGMQKGNQRRKIASALQAMGLPAEKANSIADLPPHLQELVYKNYQETGNWENIKQNFGLARKTPKQSEQRESPVIRNMVDRLFGQQQNQQPSGPFGLQEQSQGVGPFGLPVEQPQQGAGPFGMQAPQNFMSQLMGQPSQEQQVASQEEEPIRTMEDLSIPELEALRSIPGVPRDVQAGIELAHNRKLAEKKDLAKNQQEEIKHQRDIADDIAKEQRQSLNTEVKESRAAENKIKADRIKDFQDVKKEYVKADESNRDIETKIKEALHYLNVAEKKGALSNWFKTVPTAFERTQKFETNKDVQRLDNALKSVVDAIATGEGGRFTNMKLKLKTETKAERWQNPEVQRDILETLLEKTKLKRDFKRIVLSQAEKWGNNPPENYDAILSNKLDKAAATKVPYFYPEAYDEGSETNYKGRDYVLENGEWQPIEEEA